MVFGPLQHRDGVVVDVGSDPGRPRRVSGRQHADGRVEDDARRRIQHLQPGRSGAGEAGEVRSVLGGVRRHVGTDQRNALRPDDVVGGQRTAPGEIAEVGPRHEAGHRVVGVPGHDHGLAGHDREVAAQPGELRGIGRRQRRAGLDGHRGVVAEPRLGGGDQLDMTGVRRLGVVAEGEEPVVEEHEADRRSCRVFRPQRGDGLGEIEAGHHVRHDHDAFAVDLADGAGAVAEVGQRHHHVGVAVEHGRVREQRMQQALDRGRRRARIEAGGEQLAHHLLV